MDGPVFDAMLKTQVEKLLSFLNEDKCVMIFRTLS